MQAVPIPKRILNHGLHVPRWERLDIQPKVQYANLSAVYTPRTDELERSMYSTDYSINMSHARDSEGLNVGKPLTDSNPRNRICRIEGGNQNSHWKVCTRLCLESIRQSTYKNCFEGKMAHKRAPIKPSTDTTDILGQNGAAQSATSTSRYFFETLKEGYARSLSVDRGRFPSLPSEFSIGSTKGTSFIPGYQGHIGLKRVATNPPAPSHAARAYSLEIPGYTGYKPRSIVNFSCEQFRR